MEPDEVAAKTEVEAVPTKASPARTFPIEAELGEWGRSMNNGV